MKKIWLSSPHMGDKERVYVEEAFSSNWIAPLGPQVDAFEHELARRLRIGYAAALNSGTAALHLALKVLGVKAGDRVICQSFTFAASAFPITYLGAQPVFVDSEYETWNMDPFLLSEAIKDQMRKGKKPAAIVVVHLYGMPAKMKEILEIAESYEIPVIEDAAEALGSTYHGSPCGSLGFLSVLSFNGNKIITTSGGGALCGNDEKIIERARFFSTQARENAPYYLHKENGYNYRLSNVLAAIGRGQLEVLDDRVEKRRGNFEFYKSNLGDIPGLFFQDESLGSRSNRWLTTLLFDGNKFPHRTNEKIRIELDRHEIETRPLWKPLHQQPVFSGVEFYGNGVSDDLYDRGLCLPSGSNLNEEQIRFVVHTLKEKLNEIC